MSLPTWFSCNLCNNQSPTLNRCSRCRSVLYCSPKCQQDDWINHQKKCKLPQTFSYYQNNQIVHDAIPNFNLHSQKILIFIKQNRIKKSVLVQESWTSEEIYKFFCSVTKIPIESIKIIHGGKQMKKDDIKNFIKTKAVFQVIGQSIRDFGDVDQRDIDVLIRDFQIDLNEAVGVLREKKDLIDAIMYLGDKQ